MDTMPLSYLINTNNNDPSSLTTGGQSSARQLVGKPSTQGTHKSDKQEVTFAIEKVTCSQFAWKKGFLTTHNPPTHWPLPWSKPHHSTHSTNLPTNANATVSANSGDKGQNVDSFQATSNWDIPGIQVPQMARPSASTPMPPLSADMLLSTCLQCYDLCLCLYGQNGKIYSKWEALTSFLLQLQAINNSIQLIHWQAHPDYGSTLQIAISQSSHSFFHLHTYVP